MSKGEFPGWHGTTIIGVRKDAEVVIAGDGQVSLGQTVIKGSARKLEAMLIVTDGSVLLVSTGAGVVLEPEHGIAAIGSGGNYALAAARAVIDGPDSAEAIARKAMGIAADICVYTNGHLTVERISD